MYSFITDNILGILIAIIIILIYIKIKSKYNYFKERGIFYVKPTWKESLNSLKIGSMMDYPLNVYTKTRNDKQYVGMCTADNKPAILINDPSLVEDIFIKSFSHFHDHGFEQNTERDPLANHLFNMRGDKWRKLRNKLLPTFTSGKLKGMVPLIEQCADDLINDMKKDNSLIQDTNMKELFRRYTLAVIAICAFGIDPKCIQDPECEFQQAVESAINPTLFRKFKISIMFIFPWIGKLMKMKFFPKNVDDFFLNMTKDTLNMRKKSGEKRNDFIQLLLELREKGSVEIDTKELEEDEKINIQGMQTHNTNTKLEITDSLLTAQIFIFLIAGYDNSGFLGAITAYELSKHPEMQKRVREEIKEMKLRHGKFDYLALRDMKLLGACVDESLRLHSPLPLLFRECTQSYTFKDGVKIDKGVAVLIPSQGLHLDARYWSNPEQFNPDRFLDKSNITPGTYMPFGDGPRLCIAQRLALIVTKLVIAKVLENFEILPSPKTKEPVKTVILVSSDFEGGAWGSFKPLKAT